MCLIPSLPPLLLASPVHLQVRCHTRGFHVQQCPQNPLISLRCDQVLGVVLLGHDALHYSHNAPKGPLLVKKEERNGSKTVETLAVAHFWVVPAESYKDTPKFVDLERKKEAF